MSKFEKRMHAAIENAAPTAKAISYEKLATELTRRLFGIDDICSTCANLTDKTTFCDHYKETDGEVDFNVCRDGLKKFIENNNRG